MTMQVKIDNTNVYHKGPIQATYHEYTEGIIQIMQ